MLFSPDFYLRDTVKWRLTLRTVSWFTLLKVTLPGLLYQGLLYYGSLFSSVLPFLSSKIICWSCTYFLLHLSSTLFGVLRLKSGENNPAVIFANPILNAAGSEWKALLLYYCVLAQWAVLLCTKSQVMGGSLFVSKSFIVWPKFAVSWEKFGMPPAKPRWLLFPQKLNKLAKIRPPYYNSSSSSHLNRNNGCHRRCWRTN